MRAPSTTENFDGIGAAMAPDASVDDKSARNVQGMACLDTSGNERIAVMMELVGAISRARTPQEVLRGYSAGTAKLREKPRGFISLSTRGLAPGQYRITRFLADTTEQQVGAIDSWSHPGSYSVSKGGWLGQLIRSAWPAIIHHLDVPDDPVLGDRLSAFGSLMAIPLFDNGEPLNWAIILSRDAEAFNLDDLEHEILQSNLVGGTVRRAIMAQELERANARAALEVAKIADIQRALLPSALPEIPGVSLGASYATFDEAGGDSYDFVELDQLPGTSDCGSGRWAILIADASGHGPAAAVVMAMLHAIVHAFPTVPCGPSEVLEHASRHLTAKQIEHSFVTAFLGFFNPETRRLTWARAGHHPPIHMQPLELGWRMRRLDDVGGVPLGVADNVSYEEATLQLEPGETLVLYTDGVTEARSRSGEMFGVEGIERSLTRCTGYPQCVIDHVGEALLEHEGGVRPSDDQTLVVLRVNDEQDGLDSRKTAAAV